MIKALSSTQEWAGNSKVDQEFDRLTQARKVYVDRVLSFVDVNSLRPLPIYADTFGTG